MASADEYIAISQLIHRLWRALDNRDFDQLHRCLAPKARWMREGTWQVGHDAIAAALARRPQTLFITHIVSNLTVSVSNLTVFGGPVQFDCRHYITAYASQLVDIDEHHRAEAPVAVTDVAIICHLLEGSYKIAEVNPSIRFLRDIPGS